MRACFSRGPPVLNPRSRLGADSEPPRSSTAFADVFCPTPSALPLESDASVFPTIYRLKILASAPDRWSGFR